MSIIRILDEITANQIAAGEVVERPSSVVKELLENCFDAGSTRITVEIGGGGLELIKVTDNGCGMDEADAETAFQRHATSKIAGLADIENIVSLGFRGEALPSIAAVSRIKLSTRPPENTSGTKLEIEGGRLLSKEPAGCPPGTIVHVRDLFFNTPARLKYMKSKTTEAGQITDIVQRLALSRPDVSIKLENEGRRVFHTPGTGIAAEAMSAVYGPEAARNLLPLEAVEEGMAVRGLISPPSMGRSTKRNITVIINGRYVKNYLINTAIIEGYGTLIPPGRYPVALIYVDLLPEILDVNVHPSKMVIRVSGESHLFNLVRRTVMAALRTERVIPGLEATDTATGVSDTPKEYPYPKTVDMQFFERPVALISQALTPEKIDPYPINTGYNNPLGKNPAAEVPTLERDQGSGSEELFDSLYPIGFLPPTYILAGSGSGLLIIDHHAAHERILYEKFMKTLGGGSVEVQILLVPLAITISPREYRVAEEYLDYFSQLGILMEGLGSDSLLIREIPSWMSGQTAEEIVRDLLEYIIESGKKLRRDELIRKMAASAACREAIKSGTRSTVEEARSIIDQLKKTEVPYTCPHGRPTMIVIGERELKSRFKRT